MDLQDQGNNEAHESKDSGPGPSLMGAGTLTGNSVYNHLNENLGSVKEIMLNMQTGRVEYVVLAFGGFMGIAEKLFAVPWKALKLDTTNKCFVLYIKKENIENAPGFDKSDWPSMVDEQWIHSIHTYYGTHPTSNQ